MLFDELALPVIKKTKTARSTDHDVLEQLAPHHELPRVILEHRGLAKLKNTYLDALPQQVNPDTGRIHSHFNQSIAATGRLSSSDPNLQNIPIRSELGRSIRKAFVPEAPYTFFAADYSQIELRLLAHLSQDPELLRAFQEDSDVHRQTAQAIFAVPADEATREQRDRAKTVNFAVIYGQSQFSLAKNLGISRPEAKHYIDAFFAQYAGVARFFDTLLADAHATGVVHTLAGRQRPLPDLKNRNHALRSAAERMARNTPIQGSAADILKIAMIRIDDQLRKDQMQSRMLLTVHDELVFESPAEEQQALEKLVVDHMQNAMSLSVPLKVEAKWGNNWHAAH